LWHLQQATLQGFEARGLTQAEGEALLQKSVIIACEERDRFWDQYIDRIRLGLAESGMYRRALIAASIGSYGAFLADGSEYSGDYGPDMTKTKLKDFHRRRLLVLADAGADLLALETIPCKLEAQALVEILEEEDIQIPSWLVFNSKDGFNVVNGDSFDECIALAANSKKVVAVGINCTPPHFIDGMIQAARKVTSKPIVVYPNSGECYDGIKKEWIVSYCVYPNSTLLKSLLVLWPEL
jgi:homocysteine S-methyltransferase